MAVNRTFGIVMVILSALLLWFVAAGSLTPAPILLFFAGFGGLGALGLGVWSLLGKY